MSPTASASPRRFHPSGAPAAARRMVAAVAVLALSGCMVGPDFHRPSAPVPAGWIGSAPEAPAPAVAPGVVTLAGWWRLFDDPVLTELIDRAVRANLEVLQAQARVRQARAAVQGAASFLWPTVNTSGSARRTRTPGFQGNRGNIDVLYEAGFDASWELDVFGGVRRDIEASEADLAAAREELGDVLVSLTGEVAQTYIDLRSFQERIAIARGNLETQRRNVRITRQRFEAGFVSGLDVANAEAQAATTASVIPLLESAARQAIYRLSILLGRDPAALLTELETPAPLPLQPPTVPLGLPSDLLRRRADIRRAEARAHAASARVGVATADLYPRFTIGASAGLTSTDGIGSIGLGNRFWSIGPVIDWNLFDAGRSRATIEQRRAVEDESVLAFQRTVLTALQEVENALIASSKEQEHRDELVRAVAGNRRALDLALRLYTNGQTDFLSVLQAERALFLTEDELAQSTGTVLTQMVALYKALGGGWGEPPAGDGASVLD